MKRLSSIIAGATVLATLFTGCAKGGTPVLTVTTAPAVSATTAQTTGPSKGVQVTFTDSNITASSANGLDIDGTSMRITASGTYTLSGKCKNGSVKVKKGVTGVTLILNGLDLTSEATAPIVCAKGSEVTIEIAAGTENALTDTEANNDETGNENAENAVIKCKDGSQVTLGGTGALNIQANGKNGIKSGASTQEEGEASLTIQDLTLNISAPNNDAINAEATLNVESGSLTISAGDDAIHADNTLNIGTEATQGPTIRIDTCYEGLEGATVNIYSGDVTILSTDDCINAANPDLQGFDYSLNISGGTILAYASTGDGFDSNGSMSISGGTVAVWTANQADNSPLDADGTITVSGGTVLAAGGSSGMGLNLDAQQACVVFSGSSDSQGKGFGSGSSIVGENSSFAIADSQGNVLYSGDSKCNTAFLLFSAPEAADGVSYTLSSGGSSATAQAQSGTISTGRGGMLGGMGRPGGDRTDGNGQGSKDFNRGEKPDGQDFDPSQKPDRQPKGDSQNESDL